MSVFAPLAEARKAGVDKNMAILKTHLKSDADSKVVQGTYERYKSSLSRLTKDFVDCGFGPRKSSRVFYIHERMEECRRILKSQNQAMPGESKVTFAKRKRWADNKLMDMEFNKRAAWQARRVLQSLLKDSRVNAQPENPRKVAEVNQGSFSCKTNSFMPLLKLMLLKSWIGAYV